MEQKGPKEEKGRKYIYFIDKDKYEVDDPTITGALIRAQLPGDKRDYLISLEGHGNDPDQVINDETSVSLEQGAKHFYITPNATFGL